MQAIYRAQGLTIDYTPGSDVEAGQVVVSSGFVGIASRPIPANTLGALQASGVFEVVKAASEAISDRSPLYWDAAGNPQGGTAGTGCFTAEPSGNTFAGYAVAAADANAERVMLLLHRSPAITVHESISHEIVDPGDEGAIAPTSSGTVALVTTEGGGETRDLADPEFVGQLLALTLDTDGGDCVITAESAVNQNGDNTLTFDNAGETIVLIGVSVGGDPKWRVLSNDGVGLTTEA